MHEIASHLRRMEADIVVDLMGYTGECRSRIFTLRPAPLAGEFSRLPGNDGRRLMDYIIADRIVVPDGAQERLRREGRPSARHVSAERFDADDRRANADARRSGFARAGLRVRIVQQCLQILARDVRCLDAAAVAGRGQRALAAGRITPWRRAISFAKPWRRGIDRATAGVRQAGALAVADHLARLRLADLFLDTLPYNAHSTANDALWAGLPVLTCLGNSFAGRVAASLLLAVGLPELVTESPSSYEALALKLARETELLAAVKAKLKRNRDTARVVRHGALHAAPGGRASPPCGSGIRRANRPRLSPSRASADGRAAAMSEQILQNAWRLHQAGNLNEAARLYQEVLRANPRNFNALQLLGLRAFPARRVRWMPSGSWRRRSASIRIRWMRLQSGLRACRRSNGRKRRCNVSAKR